MYFKCPPVVAVSARELISLGLPIGCRQTPVILADFFAGLRKQRRNRRRGTVGNIDVVNLATSSAITMLWDVARSTGLPTALGAKGPVQTSTTTVRQAVNYTLGSSGVGAINQVAQSVVTVTNGSPNAFDLSVWAYNVIGDASATFSAIKELWVELLTATQYGSGATASAVVLGASGANDWAGPAGVSGGSGTPLPTYTITAGGMWHHQDQTSAGITVNSGDLLQVANSDSGNHATVRITAFGFK